MSKYQLLENLSRLGFAQPAIGQTGEEKPDARILAQIIQRFYKGKIELPVLPRVAQDVQNLMDSQDPSIEDLAKIIKTDILLSSKVISIANSALYKGVDKADSLKTALGRLGMKATYGLISTLVTKDLFKSGNKALNSLLEKLWMHSFASACIGKRIAEELKADNAETVFLMGIVHDIGKILLMKALVDMNPEESFENTDLLLAIHEIHTTFGAAVLKKMRFSKELIQIAEFHHWNKFSKDDEQELLIVHLANYLAKEIGFSFFDFEENDEQEEPGSLTNLSNLASLKQLGLTPDKAMEIAEELKGVIHECAGEYSGMTNDS